MADAERHLAYTCKLCGYQTSHKGHWDAHILTAKHNRRCRSAERKYECPDCGRAYKHRQSLHKHKRRCAFRGTGETPEACTAPPPPDQGTQDTTPHLDTSALMDIIKQLIPKVSQPTTTTHVENNINIQILLNERCPDAMTIQSFVTNLKLSIDDILRHKDAGRASGVSHIVKQNLKPLSVVERPIHCAPGADPRWLIHDEVEGWREDTGSALMREASFGIGRRFQTLWDAAYPSWKRDDRLRARWMEMVACLNADPTEEEISSMLRRLRPDCRLTLGEVKKAIGNAPNKPEEIIPL